MQAARLTSQEGLLIEHNADLAAKRKPRQNDALENSSFSAPLLFPASYANSYYGWCVLLCLINVCCSGCFSSRSNCAHLASLARESGDSTRRVSPPATQLLVVRLSLDGRVQHSARAGRCDGGREKLARRDVATGVDVAAAARCRGGARGDGVRKLAWRRGAPNSERFCVTTAVTGNRISCSSVCVARRRARAEGPVGRRGSRVCGVRSCAVTCVCK